MKSWGFKYLAIALFVSIITFSACGSGGGSSSSGSTSSSVWGTASWDGNSWGN